jgi:hypothetical protein
MVSPLHALIIIITIPSKAIWKPYFAPALHFGMGWIVWHCSYNEPTNSKNEVHLLM